MVDEASSAFAGGLQSLPGNGCRLDGHTSRLEKALDCFDVDVVGIVALDVGASTGGFTDCLLQRGARKVIAVDVGYGQLADRLRQDPRVHVMERTNIRHLEPSGVPASPDLATIDVSFISLRLVLPVIRRLLAPPADVVALVKPQFEVGKGQVGKGGVVREPEALSGLALVLVQHEHREQQLGAGVLGWRLAGALLMLSAVALVVLFFIGYSAWLSADAMQTEA